MTAPNWEVLQALFWGALQRPRNDRPDFLRDHSHGNEAIRLEVESLLRAHEQAGTFLKPSALEPAGATESSIGLLHLAAGSQVGTFEILDLLGSGGMGEVYRARDTRLDRFVAVKVLSPALATDSRGRERFEREARAISKLSHPHICTVHDVGSAHLDTSDVPFLVMELLEGETLADRLARGPLPLAQALTFGVDIAEALAAAHGQGVVHRDLKPANVMLTRSGVKLLDFGLAQLRVEEKAGPIDAPITSAGLVFGTLPYMAPEQLRGEKTDTRTDVFAFGALLHEMLTGSRPFVADSQAALIAALLEHDPRPVSELQPLAPASLDRIVRKCLAKDPQDRWQTALDLKSELQWISSAIASAQPVRRSTRSTERSTQKRRSTLWYGAATLLACVIAGLVGWRLAPRPPTSRVVTRLSLNFPPGVTLSIPISGVSFAVAPDGARVAYVGVRDGREHLFVHALDAEEPIVIAGTEGATSPAFSPDGEWIAFFQAGAVKRTRVAGGPVEVLHRILSAMNLTWTRDNRLLRGGQGFSIEELPVGGGPRKAVTPPIRSGEEGHYNPVVLPNGSMLFTILRGGWHSPGNSVAVVPPEGRESREIVANATSAQVVGGDTLVFARGDTFYAARFDLAAMQLIGEPRALGLGVQPAGFSAAPMYALAANGTLVYAEAAGGRSLVWVDRQGREELANTDERLYAHLRLSPDGTRVVTYQPDGDRDLWVFGLRPPTTVTRLTFGPTRESVAVWSPDGKRIFFTSDENKLSAVAANGAGDVVTLLRGPHNHRIFPLSITPDGETLLVNWQDETRQLDQGILTLVPTPRLAPLLAESYNERDGRLSPDARWLAYASNESGVSEIVVRTFPAVKEGKWVISSGGGQQPIWSRDGRELFYRTEDGTVMAVPINPSSSFSRGSPVRLINPPLTLHAVDTAPTYDVSPDGRRFLFIRAPELDIRSLKIIQTWDVQVKATVERTRQD